MSEAPQRQSRGAWAEEQAHEFLLARGMRPLARNYRCPLGEIDLVLRDGDAVVFAEVRFRARGAWVSGAESVDRRKQRRLVATAEHFLQRHRELAWRACRFDVVGVSASGGEPEFDWIRDAFQA